MRLGKKVSNIINKNIIVKLNTPPPPPPPPKKKEKSDNQKINTKKVVNVHIYQ